MQAPLLVRPLSAVERRTVEAGRRSTDAFVLRRCQIMLASARGAHPPAIARLLGCDDQTVRNAIHAFNQGGVAALQPHSSRPHRSQATFDAARAERLRELLHRSPREFGTPTSLWTLDLAAAVSFEQRLTPVRVSGETIRATLARHGVRWRRAKRWITSPDPQYTQKNGGGTD
jgi:transposase